MDYYAINRSGYLSHHGVKGMHWGIRRYQNYDGTWKKDVIKRDAKRAAIGLGSAALAGGAAYAGYKIAGKRGAAKGTQMAKKLVANKQALTIGEQIAKSAKEVVAKKEALEKMPGAMDYLTSMRRKSLKGLGLAIGATAGGSALGAGYVLYDEDMGDKHIPAGRPIYRVNKSGKEEIHGDFYGSPNGNDFKKYDAGRRPAGGAQLAIKYPEKVDIAGRGKSIKAFNKALKNHPELDGYKFEDFNRDVVRIKKQDSGPKKELYDEFKSDLKKQGYEGIIDNNDAKPGRFYKKGGKGWGTNDPAIFFNDPAYKVKDIRSTHERNKEINLKAKEYLQDAKLYRNLAARYERENNEQLAEWAKEDAKAKVLQAIKLRSQRVFDTPMKDINKELLGQNQKLIDEWMKKAGY